MTTSHQLFLKEKKVDVVILAYLLLFVLLFTSWGQARNHHIAVRCPAKFLNFSPNLFLSFFAPRAVKGSCTVHFFYITETAKRHATARYLEKHNKILGIPHNQRIISKRTRELKKKVLFLGSSHFIFICTRTQLKRRRRTKKNSNLLTASRTWAAQLASTVFAKRNVKLHFPSFKKCNATIFCILRTHSVNRTSQKINSPFFLPP